MKRFRILVAAGLLVFSTALNSTFAQPVDPAARAPEASEYELDPEIAEKRVAKVQSDGLPLVEFVNGILVKEFPEVNFVMHADMFGEPVVLLELRSVTLPDILTALDIATRGKIHGTVVGDRMISFTHGAPRPNQAGQNLCQAFSLSGYLANRSPEEVDQALKDLEDALAKCWAMLREANPGDDFEKPRLSLHRTTKLLIVVGQPNQLAVISQLVGQLEGNIHRQLPMRPMTPPSAPIAPVAPAAPIAPLAPQPPKAPTAPVAPKAPVPPSTKGSVSDK